MTSLYAGSDWIKSCLKVEMSPLGIAVADLLGDVFLGIYHLPVTALRKVEWNHERWIEFVSRESLATVDSDELTRLLVLCHDRMIRCEIQGVGPRYMKMGFSQRTTRTGHLFERCPTLEDHIASLREHYHSVPMMESLVEAH